MKEIEFQKLNFPKGLNLHILQGFLSELELKEMIIGNCRKTRTERRIVLPSKKCLKKVICHYLCVKHQENFDLVMGELKDGFKFLKEIQIDRKQVRQLYQQRKSEIKKEK